MESINIFVSSSSFINFYIIVFCGSGFGSSKKKWIRRSVKKLRFSKKNKKKSSIVPFVFEKEKVTSVNEEGSYERNLPIFKSIL